MRKMRARALVVVNNSVRRAGPRDVSHVRPDTADDVDFAVGEGENSSNGVQTTAVFSANRLALRHGKNVRTDIALRVKRAKPESPREQHRKQISVMEFRGIFFYSLLTSRLLLATGSCGSLFDYISSLRFDSAFYFWIL